MAVKQLSDGGPDGAVLGQSATDKLGFYGATPVARRSGTAQTTVASSTDFTATHAAVLNEIVATLQGNGLWPA